MNDSPYRAASLPPPDPYLVAWADLRRRRIQRWIAFFLWAPLVAVVCELAKPSPNRSMLIALPVVVIAIAIMSRAYLFRCPACHKRFEATAFSRNPWTQSCVHCGIRRGTPKTDDAPPAGGVRVGGSVDGLVRVLSAAENVTARADRAITRPREEDCSVEGDAERRRRG